MFATFTIVMGTDGMEVVLGGSASGTDETVFPSDVK